MSKHFIVVAGKFECVKNGTERNYKYISAPHDSFEAALKDFQENEGYPFCEIEYVAEDGRTWRMDPYTLESKVMEDMILNGQQVDVDVESFQPKDSVKVEATSKTNGMLHGSGKFKALSACKHGGGHNKCYYVEPCKSKIINGG